MRGALLMCVLACGCLGDRPVSRWFDPPIEGQREVSLESAARIDQVGRHLMAANPFLGIETTIQVIGHAEPILFHRDRGSLIISDSLAQQCGTDEELAALIALELGAIAAEKRNLTRMGYVESFSQVPTANAMEASNLAADPVRMTELAKQEERNPRTPPEAEPKEGSDPAKLAAEFLRAAGYNPEMIERVMPLAKQANRDRSLVRQLGGAGREPIWSR